VGQRIEGEAETLGRYIRVAQRRPRSRSNRGWARWADDARTRNERGDQRGLGPESQACSMAMPRGPVRVFDGPVFSAAIAENRSITVAIRRPRRLAWEKAACMPVCVEAKYTVRRQPPEKLRDRHGTMSPEIAPRTAQLNVKRTTAYARIHGTLEKMMREV